MKATTNSPEDRYPVSLNNGLYHVKDLTLMEAEELRDELAEAVAEICRHFQCADETTAPGFRCHARGTVKQPDGTYLCRHHAKRVAK